jgi:CHAT domain-containing protein
MDNNDEGVNNPLKSSGLLFAGGNTYWMNDSLYRQQKFLQTEDDGILRSDEIALLDFNGCELVVLSACQTGLGYSHSSEGVYGLQRAFKLAGAKKILMSMWSVSDYHTALLMDRLYSYILSGDNV